MNADKEYMSMPNEFSRSRSWTMFGCSQIRGVGETGVVERGVRHLWVERLGNESYIVSGSSKLSAGGVIPIRVDGRVKVPSAPVQKQPHPEGQMGTVTSNDFQHDMWVTCEHVKQVRERPNRT